MSVSSKVLLDNMWQDYLKLNPLAQRIKELLEEKGEIVFNDHIALRTYKNPKCSIDILAKPFLNDGYIEKDEYHFEQKKLYAKHFEHPDSSMPKIFISELLVEKLSDSAQKIIGNLISQMDNAITSKDNFLYSGRPWDLDFVTYESLLKESEYAGWMAAFGFRPNHFTVNVNMLKNFSDIEEVNDFLKKNNIELNSSGGEIKGSKEVYLKQSSTLANKALVKFSDKSIEIPSCYYEFAKRFPLHTGELYQGFVAKSADKIFESTDQQ